jgi:hypothetical protein
MDHPVASVSEPPDADGEALHVAQKALESGAVVSIYAAAEVCLKTWVPPSFEAFNRLRLHLLLLEHHLEEPITVYGRVATERARAWYCGLISQAPPGPVDTANAEKGGGQDENRGQAGPNGGRRTIPILRLPFRFG